MASTVVSGLTIAAAGSYTLYMDLHNVCANVQLFIEGTLATSSATTGLRATVYSGTGPADADATVGPVFYMTTQPDGSMIATNAAGTQTAAFTASSGSSQTKVADLTLIRAEIGDWVKLVIENLDTAVSMTGVKVVGDFR